MKHSFLVLALILVGTMSAAAQTTTTNTDCNVFGNSVDCTSTSTDDSAARAAQAERQRENDEAMRQTGNALGAAMARGIQMHKFHKWENRYCKVHPGASWWYQFDMTNPDTRISGTCDDAEANSSRQSQESASAYLDKADHDALIELCSQKWFADSHVDKCQAVKSGFKANSSAQAASDKPIKPLPIVTPVSEPQSKEMICVEKMTTDDGTEVCKRWSEPK